MSPAAIVPLLTVTTDLNDQTIALRYIMKVRSPAIALSTGLNDRLPDVVQANAQGA